MTDPTKVLIFTGAGAGVPLDLPTSTQFGDEVTAGGVAVTKSAMEYLGGESAKDIERILATLASFQGERDFVEYMLPNLVSGIGGAHGVTQQRLAALRAEARAEIKRIKKLIFDKLGSYNHTKAVTLYRGLLTELKNRYPSLALSIITTNYDLTFENTWVEQGPAAWNDLGIDDVFFGFTMSSGRLVYDPVLDFDWKPEILEFLKVHGSLDWHRDDRQECVRSGSNTVPDNPDLMAILYPGFKGVPDMEPFKSLHGRLTERLTRADVVFVLGFAFRDAYINSIFENILRTRRDLPVYYFNPLAMDKQPKDSMARRFASEFSNFEHFKKAVEATDKPLDLASVLTPVAAR
jgi:hypothetical protein